ncbi:hypothetical protein DSO57_1026488 [Entomophthora muscae]|uniref:Uncharacterized protein n=1 Tax=Entomophthora muscae TaxID=34485 RepID=A0ACC2UBT4_9FUNG|nr:hypothetical protein DSO57_1026488 [Entomophthora muscae]
MQENEEPYIPAIEAGDLLFRHHTVTIADLGNHQARTYKDVGIDKPASNNALIYPNQPTHSASFISQKEDSSTTSKKAKKVTNQIFQEIMALNTKGQTFGQSLNASGPIKQPT